jgi:uncharacterized protein YjiS (DUF1127 family)
MTYVEKSQAGGPCVETRGQENPRGVASRMLVAILDWPARAWRNRRDLDQIMRMSPQQLRDIGLTPADVVAARCFPFHVGANIVLAHLAEKSRSSDPADGSKTTRQAATMRQPTGAFAK